MLTRKLAVAFALAAISTGALAQTSTGKTDFLGRPVVSQTNLAATLDAFDPARSLWEDVHNGHSIRQAPAASDEHKSDQPGDRALDAQKDRTSLDAAGFPQYG
jgi:hypothetical protein